MLILNKIDISTLLKAQAALEAALKAPKNDLNRDGTIQRFEFTFELAWKTLKRILKVKGIIVNNPRDTFRDAAREHLINDPQQWFEFLDYRNQTVHVYDEQIAEAIYAALPLFKTELATLIDRIQQL